MKQPKVVILALVCLGIIISLAISFQAQSTVSKVRYQTIEREKYTLHTVTIPYGSNYQIIPDISGNLQPISDFAKDGVVAAINGGYFDPVNQKTTSFMTERSQNVADPRFNERLVDNPDLKRYLRKIFNRAEFRRYDCQGTIEYDVRLHSVSTPQNCVLTHSLGGGPGLLPQNTSVAEGFLAYQNGEKIRDAIGNDSLNARSAVGITANGRVILVMVAQDPSQPLDSGISLPELAKEMSSLGAVKAMNLDGGSSASLYYDGRAIFGRVDREGEKIIRPIKSVLLVTTEKP